MIDIQKLWEKIILNSFYKTFSNDYFVLHDKEISKEITNTGNNIINEINDNSSTL